MFTPSGLRVLVRTLDWGSPNTSPGHDRLLSIDRSPPEDPEARFARLVSVLRHELMAPLSIIQGFANALAEGDEQIDGSDEALAAIRRNTKLAVLLLDRLRDADDIIRDAPIRLATTEVDIGALVSDTLDDVAGTLLANHDFDFDPPRQPILAKVDGDRIRQVLFNLLSNAAKYSDPQTTIVIDVRADDREIEIAVTNEGEGIAPEDIDRAFEAFTRLADDEKGTGLGLTISRAIARSHGGDLTAHPAPDGPGARFVLRLPR